MREVLAHAGAGLEQVVDRRADVGHARPGTRSGRGSARPACAASPAASSPRDRPTELVEHQCRRARSPSGSRNSPAAVAVARAPRAPAHGAARRRRAARSSPRARARRSRGGRAAREIPNSITVRAEVVEVLVQARLGVDADAEVVDALRRRRRRLDAQRVEVVRDGRVVAVLGEVADREVHQAVGQPGDRRARCRRSSGAAMSASTCASSRWTVPSVSPTVGALRRPRARGSRGRRSAARARRTGGEPAVARVGGGQRGVQRLDRDGHRVRVVALVEQEARDRPAFGGAGTARR